MSRSTNYDIKVFVLQWGIVEQFAIELAVFRALDSIPAALLHKSEVLTHSCSGHFRLAVITWCKIFGASKNNDIHWSQLWPGATDDFVGYACSQLSLSHEQYDEYQTLLRDFRDRYAAHRDTSWSGVMPDLELAERIAFCWDRWVRIQIAPDNTDSLEPLERSALRFADGLARETQAISQMLRDS